MSYILILRPFNCLFVGLTVLFGAWYRNIIDLNIGVLAAVLSAMLIAAGGYVINDYYDIEIDRINKPDRILPSGKISRDKALLYSLVLFISGFLISFLTSSVYCVLLALVNSILLYFYAAFWKKSFLVGNLLVAYAAGSTFIYGGLAAANLINSIIISLFAMIYTLLREITKDSEDATGDKQAGARTLALVLGEQKTWTISLLPVFFIAVFPFFLFSYNYYSISTLILMEILVTIPLIIMMMFIKISKDRGKYSLSSRWMKIDMLILLIINWIGK